MRYGGVILFVAFLLLGGTVAFIIFGPIGDQFRTAPLPAEEIEYVKPLSSDVPPSETFTGAARASRASRGRSGDGDSSASGSASGAADAAARSAGRRFPTAADLTLGLAKDQFQAEFGVPTMRTTAVEGGTFLETFVYLRTSPNTATFVLLRDGKVISANTTPY